MTEVSRHSDPVRLAVESAPGAVIDCNRSTSRRYDALWAY
jgi:hypothetical protein